MRTTRASAFFHYHRHHHHHTLYASLPAPSPAAPAAPSPPPADTPYGPHGADDTLRDLPPVPAETPAAPAPMPPRSVPNDLTANLTDAVLVGWQLLHLHVTCPRPAQSKYSIRNIGIISTVSLAKSSSLSTSHSHIHNIFL